MLQRQQANAILSARQKIVEGAVGMVQMAISQLQAEGIVERTPSLTRERFIREDGRNAHGL